MLKTFEDLTYHAENLLLGQGRAVNVGTVSKGWIWEDLATLAWLNPTNPYKKNPVKLLRRANEITQVAASSQGVNFKMPV